MALFLVQIDPLRSGGTVYDNATAAIVNAADATAAKALVVAKFPNSDFKTAEVTAMPIDLPLVGWTLTIDIPDLDEGLTVSVTGTPSDDTLDKIAALAVTALNATSEISAAAYNSGTNTLTVAGVADELGDKKLEVRLTDDTGADRSSLIGTITSEGAPEDALTVVLPADSISGIWKMFSHI